MASIGIRIDDDVKREAEKILEELGLSTSTAINIFFRAIIREHGIPFELTTDTLKDADEKRGG